MKPNPQLSPELQAILSDHDLHAALDAGIQSLKASKQNKVVMLKEAIDQEDWSQAWEEVSALETLSKKAHKLEGYQMMLQKHEVPVPLQNPDLLYGVELAARMEEPVQHMGSRASDAPKEPRKVGEYTEPTVLEQGVLWALFNLAQPVPRRRIVEALEPIMEGHLTPDDLSLSDDGIVRWHRKTGDAATALYDRGLVALQRQGRMWFITEAGRAFVESGGIHTVVASDPGMLECAYIFSLPDVKVHLN